MSRFAAIKTDRALPPEPAEGVVTAGGRRTPARAGKKSIGGYFSPELSRALNMLAVEQGRSLQALLGEALDDLMRKYGHHPFGER